MILGSAQLGTEPQADPPARTFAETGTAVFSVNFWLLKLD